MAGSVLRGAEAGPRAAELCDEGRGRAPIATLLGMPEETVGKWPGIYRSAGIEVLAMMGKKRAACSLETKLAAVRAVADEGMAKPGAVAKSGIASPSSFRRWPKAYGEEGPEALLDRLAPKKPGGSAPIPHSDMGWRRQQAGWRRRPEEAGVVQSMSREGNCVDNGATEQAFGHAKDELFRGRKWPCLEDLKKDLGECIIHWNTRRRRVELKGLAPEEFRSRSLCAA